MNIFETTHSGFLRPINSLNYIFKKVCYASGFKEEVLLKKTRKREIVEARQAYYLLAMQLSSKTLSEIGELTGHDHASVLHAKKNAHISAIKSIIKKTNLL